MVTYELHRDEKELPRKGDKEGEEVGVGGEQRQELSCWRNVLSRSM